MKNEKGFTLIELMVVIAIVGVLTSVGLASFNSYANNQSVASSYGDVVNMVTTAKARAIAQVKPPECGSNSLTGYKVTFTNPTYSLTALCGATSTVIKSQDLPSGVTFATGSVGSVTFDVLRGTNAGGTVIVSGYGRSKNIVVSSIGTISTN